MEQLPLKASNSVAGDVSIFQIGSVPGKINLRRRQRWSGGQLPDYFRIDYAPVKQRDSVSDLC
jgi:hypothetical protein